MTIQKAGVTIAFAAPRLATYPSGMISQVGVSAAVAGILGPLARQDAA